MTTPAPESSVPTSGIVLAEGPPDENPTAGRVAVYAQNGRVKARLWDGSDVDLGAAGSGDGTSGLLTDLAPAVDVRGIETAELNAQGHLILTLTNGEVIDAGDVIEDPSNDLVSARVRTADSHLLLTMEDGTVLDAGVVGSGGGAITAGTPLDGGTFTAPNGTRYIFGVNNQGVLTTTPVA